MRTLRRFAPDVLHTHAAKAGTLGRFAALACGRARPRVIVHTFHGHSLSGYFSSRQDALFLRIERFLARRTTRLVAVSEEVREDLVRLGVAPREQIDVIRLGFDLRRFEADEATRAARRAARRAALGIPRDARVVTSSRAWSRSNASTASWRSPNGSPTSATSGFSSPATASCASSCRRSRWPPGWPSGSSGRAFSRTCRASASPATSSC